MAWRETFEAQLWTHQGPGGWHFITLPEALSARIKALTAGSLAPFGSLRVTASIGKTSWKTSLFADTKANAFLLPVKAEVRKKAGIGTGDQITACVEINL